MELIDGISRQNVLNLPVLPSTSFYEWSLQHSYMMEVRHLN